MPAVGDDATLLIDAGCVWDPRTALQRRSFGRQFGWPKTVAPGESTASLLRDRSPVPMRREAECRDLSAFD